MVSDIEKTPFRGVSVKFTCVRKGAFNYKEYFMIPVLQDNQLNQGLFQGPQM